MIPFQPRQSRQRLSPANLWGQTDEQLQNRAPANLPRAAFQQQHIPTSATNRSSQVSLLPREVGVNPRRSANCAMLDKGHRTGQPLLTAPAPVELCQVQGSGHAPSRCSAVSCSLGNSTSKVMMREPLMLLLSKFGSPSPFFHSLAPGFVVLSRTM